MGKWQALVGHRCRCTRSIRSLRCALQWLERSWLANVGWVSTTPRHQRSGGSAAPASLGASCGRSTNAASPGAAPVRCTSSGVCHIDTVPARVLLPQKEYFTEVLLCIHTAAAKGQAGAQINGTAKTYCCAGGTSAGTRCGAVVRA